MIRTVTQIKRIGEFKPYIASHAFHNVLSVSEFVYRLRSFLSFFLVNNCRRSHLVGCERLVVLGILYWDVSFI